MERKLTPAMIKTILARYKAGETIATLAKEFGVARNAIRYHINKDKKKKPPPPQPPPANFSKCSPLEFREILFEQIGADILFAKERGSAPSLQGLRKLQVEMHDQITAIKKEESEVEEMQPHELTHIIINSIATLPPILKTQIFNAFDEMKVGNLVGINDQ